MTQAAPRVPSRQFRGKLARTMLGVLLPISLIPLLLMGALAYSRSRQILISQIENTLTALEERQTEEIANWLDARQERFNFFFITPSMEQAIRVVLLSRSSDTARFREARQVILDTLEEINATGTLFHQFLLVGQDGTILVASNPNLEGLSLKGTPYYETLMGEANTLAYFNPAPIYNSLAVFMTRPYLGADNIPRATFWGLSGLSLFEDILVGSEILGARHYAVTADGTYVSIGETTKSAVGGPVIQPSDDQARIFAHPLEDTNTPIFEYTTFDEQPALATYTVIPELQLGLVTEIPTQPILEPLNTLPFFFYLLIGTVLLTAALTWAGTRRIIQPILDVAQAAQHFAEGDWLKRAVVNRNDEIGLLAYSFNRMADELTEMYRSLESQVQSRTQQVLTAADVAQIATSATSLDELMERSVQLIVERFGFYYAAIFLLDDLRENAILRESYSSATRGPIERGHSSLPVGPGSIIGLVTSTNQPYVAADVDQDPHYLKVDELPDTRSEVVIPLSVGDEVLGVLDVQSSHVNAFDREIVATLRTLANQIASALRSFNLLEATRIDLQATSALYQASHRIAEAENRDEVLATLATVLEHTPFISALFRVEEDRLQTLAMTAPQQQRPGQMPVLPIQRAELAKVLGNNQPITVEDDENAPPLPPRLLQMPRHLGCQIFTVFPIAPEGELIALLIMGAVDRERFTRANIEPYINLVDITRTTLEKVHALETIQERLNELETISTVGQSISTETNLDNLYAVIHRQITQVMGDVNFYIALYNAEDDTIEIPYMDEGDEIVSLEPFPLGQGLTSIVIRTREPLMLVEDTEARSKALGAIVTSGGAAKSWLGVPLLIGGEPIGAIVVQDLEHEHRFDDDDLRLLLTLASQVAVAIRNARLLEQTESQAQRERRLFEITTRIRRSPDMQTILKTTSEEIGKALGVRRAHIQIHLPENGDAPLEEKV